MMSTPTASIPDPRLWVDAAAPNSTDQIPGYTRPSVEPFEAVEDLQPTTPAERTLALNTAAMDFFAGQYIALAAAAYVTTRPGDRPHYQARYRPHHRFCLRQLVEGLFTMQGVAGVGASIPG